MNPLFKGIETNVLRQAAARAKLARRLDGAAEAVPG
jgi:hypothetical protein